MADPRLTRRARRDLESLPREIQEAVVEQIAAIGVDPEAAGKRLVGRLRGLWSTRVGNYRVLYTVEGRAGEQLVVVRAVRHRAVAYRPRRDEDPGS